MKSIRLYLFLLSVLFFSLKAEARQESLDSFAYEVPALVAKEPTQLPAIAAYLRSSHRDDPFAQAIALNMDGLYLSSLGRGDSALASHEKALALAMKLQNNRYLAHTCNYLGIIYFRFGALKQAAEYFDRSIRYFDIAGARAEAFSVCNNRAAIYFTTGSNDKALQLVYELLQEPGLNEGQRATLYLNLSNAYSEAGLRDSFDKYLPLAIASFAAAGEPRGIANACRQGAFTELRFGRYEAARRSFAIADSLYRQLSIGTYRQDMLAGRTELYIRTGQSDSARAGLEALRNMAEDPDLSTPDQRLAFLKLQSLWLRENGKAAEAVLLLEQALQLTDSIFKTGNAAQLYELETIYQTEKKNGQITSLQHRNRQQQFINLLLGTLGLILLLALVLLLLYFREKGRKQRLLVRYNLERKNREIEERKEKERRLNEELEVANNKVMNKALSLSEQNEFLEEMMKKMDELAADPALSEAKKWQSLRQKFARRLSGDEDWMVFLEQFEKVNKDFFGRLLERHVDLTLHEQRLCALFKIHLSTRECAAILHISPDSVKQARYRLKKKMGLGPEEDLDAYIRSVG